MKTCAALADFLKISLAKMPNLDRERCMQEDAFMQEAQRQRVEEPSQPISQEGFGSLDLSFVMPPDESRENEVEVYKILLSNLSKAMKEWRRLLKWDKM